MDYSRITRDVAVGTTPRQQDYERLHAMGVRLVINMRLWWGRPPERGLPPLQYLRLRTMDNPVVPIPTGALVRGVRAALEAIDEGGSVYAHCSRGRHRSVAMAAAILIAQGHSADAAARLLTERRSAADPRAAHIWPRILEFARIWGLKPEPTTGDAESGTLLRAGP